MSDLRASFAAHVRAARQAAGLTQEQLAEAASTSVDFLSKLERGLNSPSLETLAGLVQALSLDPAQILNPKALGVSPERVELEVRATHVMRELDDRMLTAMIEIAGALKRAETSAASRNTAGRSGSRK